jgi:hypothetical protein
MYQVRVIHVALTLGWEELYQVNEDQSLGWTNRHEHFTQRERVNLASCDVFAFGILCV